MMGFKVKVRKIYALFLKHKFVAVSVLPNRNRAYYHCSILLSANCEETGFLVFFLLSLFISESAVCELEHW